MKISSIIALGFALYTGCATELAPRSNDTLYDPHVLHAMEILGERSPRNIVKLPNGYMTDKNTSSLLKTVQATANICYQLDEMSYSNDQLMLKVGEESRGVKPPKRIIYKDNFHVIDDGDKVITAKEITTYLLNEADLD